MGLGMGWFKPKKDLPEEEIRKQRDRFLGEMLLQSQKLEKLITSDSSGWLQVCELVDDYINQMKKFKALTALDKASDTQIQELKYIDHEIYILNWFKKIPEQFIKKIETEIAKEK